MNSPSSLGSETILVVEDEPAIRRLVKLFLERAGYTVLLAEGPISAERLVRGHPGAIHLVLTDVVMPGMKGPDLAELLLGLRPGLRVVFMSGFSDCVIIHHGRVDESSVCLQKPFSAADLTEKIRLVLGHPDALLTVH